MGVRDWLQQSATAFPAIGDAGEQGAGPVCPASPPSMSLGEQEDVGAKTFIARLTQDSARDNSLWKAAIEQDTRNRLDGPHPVVIEGRCFWEAGAKKGPAFRSGELRQDK